MFGSVQREVDKPSQMALSSDSELDEFVDALDETPDTSNVR